MTLARTAPVAPARALPQGVSSWECAGMLWMCVVEGEGRSGAAGAGSSGDGAGGAEWLANVYGG